MLTLVSRVMWDEQDAWAYANEVLDRILAARRDCAASRPDRCGPAPPGLPGPATSQPNQRQTALPRHPRRKVTPGRARPPEPYGSGARSLYVAGRTGDLYKVSTETRSIVKIIENSFGGYGARSIRIAPDGRYVYAAGIEDRKLHAFSTLDDSEAWSMDLEAGDSLGLHVSRDSRLLFIALGKKNQVAVVSCASRKIISSCSAGDPIGILTSPDGKRLYVSTRESPSVVVFDVVILKSSNPQTN